MNKRSPLLLWWWWLWIHSQLECSQRLFRFLKMHKKNKKGKFKLERCSYLLWIHRMCDVCVCYLSLTIHPSLLSLSNRTNWVLTQRLHIPICFAAKFGHNTTWPMTCEWQVQPPGHILKRKLLALHILVPFLMRIEWVLIMWTRKAKIEEPQGLGWPCGAELPISRLLQRKKTYSISFQPLYFFNFFIIHQLSLIHEIKCLVQCPSTVKENHTF